MEGYDDKSFVQAARQSIDVGHFQYALQVLEQVSKDGRNSSYWCVLGRAYIGVHKAGFTRTMDETPLSRASEALDRASQSAKGKLAVEITMLQCACMELSGNFFSAAKLYNDIFLNFPRFGDMLSVRIKAAQAFKRCEMVEEALAQLQEILDAPIEPSDEADILLLLGISYEYAGIKGSKRMSKEAYKQAYKKSREAGKVKFVKQALEQEEQLKHVLDTIPGGMGLPQAHKAQPKHVPFTEWKEDPDTWTTLADKCLENGDIVFGLELYTKCLWTEEGQQNTDLWMKFGELSMMVRDKESAIQAIGTLYNMLPFDMSIRHTLGLWDPDQWGVHLRFEEQTITKVQAIVRGNWGRRVAAKQKKVVLAERARRRAAAIEIQRTVARGVQGRAKAQRRRDEIAAEIAAYQRHLLEMKAASIIQRGWRCAVARSKLAFLQKQYHSAVTIQCVFRKTVARRELVRRKAEYQERMEKRGATALQRVFRGHLGRKKAKLCRRQRHGATEMQRIFRGYVRRIDFYAELSKFRGAQAMQKIFRGYQKRMWYGSLRDNMSTKIQTVFRRHLSGKAFPLFKKSIKKYMQTLRKPSRTRFYQHLEFLSAFGGVEHGSPDGELEPNNDSSPTEPAPTEPTSGSSPSSERPNSSQGVGRDAASTSGSHGVDTLVASLSSSILVSKAKRKDGADIIAKWLEMNEREAETLWVANWRLGAKGAKRLAKILEKNESLRELGLGKGTALGPGGSHALAEAMRCHNFRLTRLYVNDQPDLRDQGAMHFMKTIGDFFFGRYARLEEVSFRNVGLADRSCVILAEGLALNNRLKSLHLEDNCISDLGAAALAEVFDRNEELLELDLSGNRIRSEGARVLANALRKKVKTHALEILRLDANLITTTGGVALLKYVQTCKGVRPMHLTVHANPFGPSLHKRIQHLCTNLPAFSQRGAVLDPNLLQHQRQRLLARQEREGKLEQPLSPHQSHFDSKGALEDSPLSTLQDARNIDLPPVKVPKRRSPYLSLPWSPSSLR